MWNRHFKSQSIFPQHLSFHAHHFYIFTWRPSVVAGALTATQAGWTWQANNTSWEQPSAADWRLWCINAPAPSLLRWDIFQAYGLLCVPGFPKGIKSLAPTAVTSKITHLLSAAFPSLPHFPTNVSWAPFLDKLLHSDPYLRAHFRATQTKT